VQLASSFTARRAVLALTACSAATVLYQAWPVHIEVEPPAPTYHYVPLIGDPTYSLEDAAKSGRGGCVPWVEPLLAHPNWSLQLVDGASGCTGDWIHNTYEVTSTGSVTWTADGMHPRQLQLTRDELAVIIGMNHIDCGRTDEVGYSYGWMRVAPGGDPKGGAGTAIPQTSMLGIVLEGSVRRAVDRYRTQRLAQIGSFEVHLIATDEHNRGRYRIDLDARGQLTIRHRSHVLLDKQVEAEMRVDLLDYLLTRLTAPPDPEWKPAKGYLVAAGARIPLAVSRWDQPEYQWLWRMFDDALYVESQQ
jgi:hypothetical protein